MMGDFLRALPSLAGRLEQFDSAATPPAPLPLLRDWLVEAVTAGQPEAHAMTLSTLDAAGHPDARVLIAKDIDDRAVSFASSAASPKGQQLQATPHAALTFYWPALGRQVRLRGVVTKASDAAAASDFRTRGPAARAIALLGRQSQALADPAELDARFAEAAALLAAEPETVAAAWTLFAFEPHTVEFFQARADRLHQRLRYSRAAPGWSKALLWP